MDWIKANYEKCLLGLAALVLLVLSAVLLLQARGFNDAFEPVLRPQPQNNKVAPVDTSELERVQSELQKPAKWESAGRGSLFVSEKYIIKDDKPVNPIKTKEMLHPPVPNDWLITNRFDLLDPNVLVADADADGFTNLEEWTGLDPAKPGSESTDPNDKKSHPPYTVKLRMKDWKQVTFPYIFKSYDGDPKKPESLEFALNTINPRGKSLLDQKLGAEIPGTKFKIASFEHEIKKDANDIEHDVSRLTLRDEAGGKTLVLTFNKAAFSPVSYATLRFVVDGSEFPVQTDQIFSLPIEPEKKYKVIELKQTEAVIVDEQTKKQITIPHL
jgi:hypothetical protein